MPASLEAGVSVSRYSIVGPIGAGGMGEVYKAQDAALERMVAIKILPPEVVKNDERRRRFVQEARSASSLNHPHIVTIHEIGEAPLASGETIHYIAMELIDGSTLKKKIHQEATDLRTLLTWLAQAADGLSKAHAAGIVHRDLKPENIMVTRDGFAKVLDFGLAKLSVRKAASDATDATLAREETREGAIMGTVAYMSPEQVMGKVVDHRSDVFSFGAVLYEAATRRRPFHADSDVDLMHAILHDKPAPIDEIAPAVPAEVRRMIRRCLAKDPDRRYQSMKDLAIELREIVEEYDELSVSASSRGSGSQSSSVAPIVPKRGLAIWIAAGVALVVVAVAAWLVLRGRTTAPGAAAAPPGTVAMQKLTSIGTVYRAQISRDGRFVAHAVRNRDGRSSLRVRQVATGSDVEVTTPSEGNLVGAAFSPDGNYVYYAGREKLGDLYGWLYQVPALGGTPKRIVDDVDSAPAFSPDGKVLAFARGVPSTGEIHYVAVNADGSGQRVLAKFPRLGAGIPSSPAWSADGKKLYAARPIPPAGSQVSPVEIDVATGGHRDLTGTKWWWITSVAPTPDGRALLLSAIHRESGNAQVWLQPLPDGQPRRLTNDFTDYGSLSLTGDGDTLAAVNSQTDGELYVTSLDDASGGTPVDEERSRAVQNVTVTPSGALVYGRIDNAALNIAILDAGGSQPRLLTSDGSSGFPSVTADGKTIVHDSWSGASPHVRAVAPDGTGARQLTNGKGEFGPVISPDGSMLLYRDGDALWRRATAGGTPVKVAERGSGSAGFSADSTKIFYTAWVSKAGEQPTINLRVEPVAGGAPLLDLPTRGSGQYRWAPKGEGLTFLRAVRGVGNLYLQKLDGSEPVQLTKFTRGFIQSYDWMPDGKLVYVRRTETADVVLLTGLSRQ